MIKILELFAGIGACSKAFENLGIPHEIVDAVEIDKYAIKSFNAIHGTNFEAQDITTWNKDIECDLIMHGSPCQDFSIAGKGAGGDKDSGTRSSLMYETLRIVEKLRPKYVIWENVKNILSKKHIYNFEAYQKTMKELGYVNYYKVLNAKDYGIPQNRERVFTISIRNDVKNKRFYFPEPFPLEKKLKDILDDNVDEKYYISDKQLHGMIVTNYSSYKLSALLRDKNDIANTIKARFEGNPQLVEDEKLRIKTNNKKGFDEANLYDSINMQFPSSKTRRGRVGHQVSQTLQTSDNMAVVEPICIASRGRNHVQHLEPRKDDLTNTITSVQKDNYVVLPGAYGRNFGSKGKIQDLDKECSTLQAAMGAGGGNIPLVAPKDNYVAEPIIDNPLKDKTKYGWHFEQQVYGENGIVRTVKAGGGSGNIPKVVEPKVIGGIGEKKSNGGTQWFRQDRVYDDKVATSVTAAFNPYYKSGYRIRKLTPKECWRLMGFDDSDFEKAEKVNSNTQLYKQAGNSIVVNVLEEIIKNLILS